MVGCRCECCHGAPPVFCLTGVVGSTAALQPDRGCSAVEELLVLQNHPTVSFRYHSYSRNAVFFTENLLSYFGCFLFPSFVLPPAG